MPKYRTAICFLLTILALMRLPARLVAQSSAEGVITGGESPLSADDVFALRAQVKLSTEASPATLLALQALTQAHTDAGTEAARKLLRASIGSDPTAMSTDVLIGAIQSLGPPGAILSVVGATGHDLYIQSQAGRPFGGTSDDIPTVSKVLDGLLTRAAGDPAFRADVRGFFSDTYHINFGEQLDATTATYYSSVVTTPEALANLRQDTIKNSKLLKNLAGRINELASTARTRSDPASWAHVIREAHGSIAVAEFLLQRSGLPGEAKQVSASAHAAVNVIDVFHSFKAGSIGTMAMAGNVVGAITTVASLFEQQQDPVQLQLQGMTSMLADIQRDLQRLQLTVASMYSDMLSNFGALLDGQAKTEQQLRQLSNDALAQRQQIERLSAATMWGLREVIETEQRARITKCLEPSIVPGATLSTNDLDDCARAAIRSATEWPRSLAPQPAADIEIMAELLSLEGRRKANVVASIESNYPLYQTALREYFGIPTARLVGDPGRWLAGAQIYERVALMLLKALEGQSNRASVEATERVMEEADSFAAMAQAVGGERFGKALVDSLRSDAGEAVMAFSHRRSSLEDAALKTARAMKRDKPGERPCSKDRANDLITSGWGGDGGLTTEVTESDLTPLFGDEALLAHELKVATLETCIMAAFVDPDPSSPNMAHIEFTIEGWAEARGIQHALFRRVLNTKLRYSYIAEDFRLAPAGPFSRTVSGGNIRMAWATLPQSGESSLRWRFVARSSERLSSEVRNASVAALRSLIEEKYQSLLADDIPVRDWSTTKATLGIDSIAALGDQAGPEAASLANVIYVYEARHALARSLLDFVAYNDVDASACARALRAVGPLRLRAFLAGLPSGPVDKTQALKAARRFVPAALGEACSRLSGQVRGEIDNARSRLRVLASIQAQLSGTKRPQGAVLP